MHEFSIAAQIVESVADYAEAQGASAVLKVRLRVGELACVEAEQLRFCYESITHGTVMENSALEIETFAAEVQCPHCHYHGPPKYWEGALAGFAIPTLQCPGCGRAAEAVQGREVEIKSVQFRTSVAAETSV